MPANKNTTRKPWVDPDDAPELPPHFFTDAEITEGGKLVRPATGTLKRGGRPKAENPKVSLNLRLDPDVMAAELQRTLELVHAGKLREHSVYHTLPAELLKLHHVTLSGDGEPTLAPNFVEAVREVIHVRALEGGRLGSPGEFWQALGGKPRPFFNYSLIFALPVIAAILMFMV